MGLESLSYSRLLPGDPLPEKVQCHPHQARQASVGDTGLFPGDTLARIFTVRELLKSHILGP